VLARVYKKELVLRRGPALAPDALVREQDDEAFPPVGMVAGRVQARKRRMGQDVDASDASRSASALRPRPRAKEDASAQVGD
jgi:hypothetical protein